MRLFPRKFFLDKIYIPGKWLIFWYGCILAKIYCLQCPSIQRRSKLNALIGYVEMFHFNFLATSLTTGYWHSKLIFVNTNNIDGDFLWIFLFLLWFLFVFVRKFGVKLIKFFFIRSLLFFHCYFLMTVWILSIFFSIKLFLWS